MTTITTIYKYKDVTPNRLGKTHYDATKSTIYSKNTTTYISIDVPSCEGYNELHV